MENVVKPILGTKNTKVEHLEVQFRLHTILCKL